LKILPVFFENCIFERVQVFNQGLVFIVKWRITSSVYRHSLYKKLLSKTISSVFVYKRQKCM